MSYLIKLRRGTFRSGLLVGLRRHNRLVAFFGASLVLATYVVKDELKEQAKDELAGIEAKRARLWNDRVLSSIQRDILEGAVRPAKQPNQTNGGEQLQEAESSDRQKMVALVNECDRFFAFGWEVDKREADDLPYALEPYGGAYSDAFQKKAAEFDKAMEHFSTSFIEARGDLKVRIAYMTHELDQLKNAIAKVEEAMRDTILSIDQELRREERDAGVRYTRFRSLSIILYVVGWGLALAGQLLGIRGVVRDD